MIIDNLKNSETYYAMNSYFPDIFSKIKSITKTDIGKKFVLNEGVAWVSISATDYPPDGERQFEAHRNFLDIHFVLAGEESFAYADVDTLTPITEYNLQEDYVLLTGRGNEFTLRPGDFCIVYPQDAHIPKLKKLSNGALIHGVAKIKL